MLIEINSLVELVIFLTTMIIGAYTLRVHQFTKNRNHKLLGIGFVLISISFLTKILLNLSFAFNLVSGQFLMSFLTLAYSAFLLFGYTVFDKLFIDVKSLRFFSVQIILFGLSLFLIQMVSLWFLDFVAFLLLAYPVIFFWENYSKKKTRNSLMILLAFAGLMISHASFALIFINSSLFFVDNLIRLASFTILFVNYVLVNK